MNKIYIVLALFISALNSSAQECVELTNVRNPGWLFDPGTVIYDQGGIKLKTGDFFSHYGFDSGGNLQFGGYLHMDVSHSDCPEKMLEVVTNNSQHIVVDGDTVDTWEPGLAFPIDIGAYVIEQKISAPGYIVTGDFNEVAVGWSTQMIMSICLVEDCLGVGSESIESSEVKVYPNPALSVLNVDADFEKLEIMNLLGETVLVVNNQTKLIDVSGFSTGTYFIKSTNGNTSSITKFIKK